MKIHRSRYLGVFVPALAFAFAGHMAPANSANEPTFFTYQFKDGVIVDGAQKTYVPLGKAYEFRYMVDNVGQSGPGKLTFRLYSDGTLVWTQSVNVSANGTFSRKVSAHVFTQATKNFGPFYICATASLASGKSERKGPCTKWWWLPIEVPIQYVSNGCGGMTGIKWIDKAQTWFLDTKKFGGVIVDLRDACNVHDAAYSGVTARDKFVNKVVDYHLWTRVLIDKTFETELQQLCVKYMTPKLTDPKVAAAMPACITNAHRYYNAVRLVGGHFYDANPVVPGIQTIYLANEVAGIPYGFGVERNNK